MELTTVWFVLIAVLWIGYFCLEGFDFGVGMLLPVLARNETERRVMINTIGPVWDGNEVWVLVAGGATFAAFPEWYATLFSGFYLPLLLILVALIVRGLAFEYRHKRDERRLEGPVGPRDHRRARSCRRCCGASPSPTSSRGVPIDADKEFTGNLLHAAQPLRPARRAGHADAVPTHGAMFVALKTDGDIRHRARDLAVTVGAVAAVLAVVFLVWTQVEDRHRRLRGRCSSSPRSRWSAASLVARAGREGWAFVGTFVTIALAVAGLFVALFPDVMPSTTDPAYSLTTTNAAATAYTLKVMTWVAVIFTPIVLGYQAWTYWVFRKRIAVHHIPDGRAWPRRRPS